MRRSFRFIQKLSDEIAKATVHCPHCGHSMVLGLQDKVICSHCKNYVFKNKKVEFEYRVKENLCKERRNEI